MTRYTTAQAFIIRDALAHARQAIEQQGLSALVFANAFLEANGLQQPAAELSKLQYQTLAGHILEALGGTPCYSQRDAWEIELIERECQRIQLELKLAHYRQHSDFLGFRLRFSTHSQDQDFCQRVASYDLYGMGPGVFPAYEIVVLQPGCNDCDWEAIAA